MPEQAQDIEQIDAPEQGPGDGNVPPFLKKKGQPVSDTLPPFLKKKESANGIGLLNPNDFKQRTVSESTPQPVIPKLSGRSMQDVLQEKQNHAQATIQNELTANNDIVPNIIKKQKTQAQQQENLSAFAERPRSDMPQTHAAQLGASLQPEQAPTEVSPEEVNDFIQAAQTDPAASRSFLKEVVKAKPEKAKPIQAAMYMQDATQRLADKPGVGEKMGKVLQNTEKIENGEHTYDIQTATLKKPENAWQSIGTGLKAKNQAFADYELFNNATPDQAISELEKRRASFDPDEPVPVPESFAGELTGGMASQPIKGLLAGKVAGIATAAIPGAEEYAPVADRFIAAAVSGNDYRKMTYAHSLQQNYYQLRNEGVSPEEAYQKANGQAKDEAMVDAISGAAMMYGAGAIGDLKLPKFHLSEGFHNAVVNGLKQGAKGIGEAGAVGMIQGTAQDIKNKLAEAKGIARSGSGEDIEEAVKSGTLFTLGLAAIAKGIGAIGKTTKQQLLQGLSKVSPEQVNAELGHQIMEGHITPEEAQTAAKAVQDHKAFEDQLPANITPETRLKIMDKIDRRKELEDQLEKMDKAYHPDIKEKIKALNEDILELSKDKIPRGTEDILSPKTTNNGEKTENQTGQVTPEEPRGGAETTTGSGAASSIEPVSDKIQPISWARTLDYGENKGKEENEQSKADIKQQILNDEPIGKTGDKFSDFLGRVIPNFKKVMDEEGHNTTLVTHSSVRKALRVWEKMGRPDIAGITGDKLKEFAEKYVKEPMEKEGTVDTFKGDNGNEIKVVRHGETEDNKLSEFRQDDTQLTDKGQAQAKKAGQTLLKETGGDIPQILTSDLPRAIHTANLIHGELTGEKTPENFRNEARSGLPVKSSKYEFLDFSEVKKFGDAEKYLRHLEREGIIKIDCT